MLPKPMSPAVCDELFVELAGSVERLAVRVADLKKDRERLEHAMRNLMIISPGDGPIHKTGCRRIYDTRGAIDEHMNRMVAEDLAAIDRIIAEECPKE